VLHAIDPGVLGDYNRLSNLMKDYKGSLQLKWLWAVAPVPLPPGSLRPGTAHLQSTSMSATTRFWAALVALVWYAILWTVGLLGWHTA
jgi:hypothetical protein